MQASTVGTKSAYRTTFPKVSGYSWSDEADHHHFLLPHTVADPQQWSESDVSQWINWAIKEFNLEGVTMDTLTVSGKEIVSMGKDMFLAKTPLYMGDILWEHIERLLKGKLIVVDASMPIEPVGDQFVGLKRGQPVQCCHKQGCVLLISSPWRQSTTSRRITSCARAPQACLIWIVSGAAHIGSKRWRAQSTCVSSQCTYSGARHTPARLCAVVHSNWMSQPVQTSMLVSPSRALTVPPARLALNLFCDSWSIKLAIWYPSTSVCTDSDCGWR